MGKAFAQAPWRAPPEVTIEDRETAMNHHNKILLKNSEQSVLDGHLRRRSPWCLGECLPTLPVPRQSSRGSRESKKRPCGYEQDLRSLFHQRCCDVDQWTRETGLDIAVSLSSMVTSGGARHGAWANAFRLSQFLAKVPGTNRTCVRYSTNDAATSTSGRERLVWMVTDGGASLLDLCRSLYMESAPVSLHILCCVG
jgi:hypothetical protein